MKISVITPSFNQASYLERTIHSVQSQSGDFELEHIVIDGGSTDGSVEILERWKDKLWYVSEKDRGQSHAINKGVERASGEIIAWINSDDLLMPGCLQTVSQYFKTHSETRWMYGRCHIINEKDQEIRKPITWYKNLLMRRFSYHLLLLEDFICQPSTFFKKGLFEEVGGVDESLHYVMDYDLFLKFGFIAKPGVISDYLASFRFYSDCKTGGAFEKSLRSANELSRKYSAQIGMPWISWINYWFYYKRTSMIYSLLEKWPHFNKAA